MKRFFGSGNKTPPPPPPTLSEASERVEVRIQRLDEKINQLESDLRVIRDQLKKPRLPPSTQSALKQKAMRCLKQKKMFESQRDSMMSQAFNMEQANFTLQSMQDTAATVSAMKAASVTMKQQFKQLEVDSIDVRILTFLFFSGDHRMSKDNHYHQL